MAEVRAWGGRGEGMGWQGFDRCGIWEKREGEGEGTGRKGERVEQGNPMANAPRCAAVCRTAYRCYWHDSAVTPTNVNVNLNLSLILNLNLNMNMHMNKQDSRGD